MTTVNIKETINADIQVVWDAVTSLENYSWRSDVEKIKVVKDGEKFVEYTKDGFETSFNITKLDPMKTYEFEMENKNMTGSWSGKFSSQEGKTIIDFTENVTVNNIVMKIFIKKYLQKHQLRYINDLKKHLEK